MRRMAILIAAICVVGLMASESQAQHYRGHGHHGHGGGGGFAISIGNGYSGFSYSNVGRSYGNSYGYAVRRPAYAAPVRRNYYGGGRYGGGYSGGGYSGGYVGGYRGGCGGGGIVIGW